jgi:hypothetical protein
MMPVGKSGNETGLELAEGTLDGKAGKTWGLLPMISEDPPKQVPHQAMNAFH